METSPTKTKHNAPFIFSFLHSLNSGEIAGGQLGETDSLEDAKLSRTPVSRAISRAISQAISQTISQTVSQTVSRAETAATGQSLTLTSTQAASS